MEKKEYKYFLHGKLITPQIDLTEKTIGFLTKEEAFAVISDARRCCLEYENAVQDVSTDFFEKDGKCIATVTTHRGNYADSYEEYCLTDADGNHINITWADIDAAEKR